MKKSNIKFKHFVPVILVVIMMLLVLNGLSQMRIDNTVGNVEDKNFALLSSESCLAVILVLYFIQIKFRNLPLKIISGLVTFVALIISDISMLIGYISADGQNFAPILLAAFLNLVLWIVSLILIFTIFKKETKETSLE